MPLTLQPLAVTRGVSIETVNRALGSDRLILLVLQDNESEDPGPEDLRKIGTVGVIRQMAKAGLGINIILEGIARVRLDSVTRAGTSMRAQHHPHARNLRAHARSGRARAAHPGADRQDAVAGVGPLGGAARRSS